MASYVHRPSSSVMMTGMVRRCARSCALTAYGEGEGGGGGEGEREREGEGEGARLEEAIRLGVGVVLPDGKLARARAPLDVKATIKVRVNVRVNVQVRVKLQ